MVLGVIGACFVTIFFHGLFHSLVLSEDKKYSFGTKHLMLSYFLCILQASLFVILKEPPFDLSTILTLVIFTAFSLSFIVDINVHELPDCMTLITLLCAAGIILLNGYDNYIGELIITPIVCVILFAIAYFTEGFGIGDVKLAVPIMLLIPWVDYLNLYFCMFVPAALYGVSLWVRKKDIHQHFAFGPFMILGFFLTLVGFDPMVFFVH